MATRTFSTIATRILKLTLSSRHKSHAQKLKRTLVFEVIKHLRVLEILLNALAETGKQTRGDKFLISPVSR